MATRTISMIVDDITGKELKAGAGETITFAIDNVQYELDVDKKTAHKIRDAFAPYIQAGRKVGRVQASRTMRHTSTGVDPASVRAWAKAHRIKVNARGRIAASVIEQYRAAGN